MTLRLVEVGVDEIEHHLANVERWLGAFVGAGRVAGETMTPFQLTSGNNAYGAWVQIMDVNDTPIIPARVAFDSHRIYIDNVSNATVFRLQIGWGASGAAALAANNYSEFLFRADAVASDRRPIDFRMPHQPAHTLLWARCWNGTNLATFNFYIGVHEYAAP